ncbi:hypothetical protein M2323_001012 [Rhodoblastus acidophilus]|uniref:BLUF domain-containing protein n=1 Tax=Rhodoblastus acidophilus TaxID=1074 RepID=UPI002224CBEA|nr:BLUF domain-containing protein [Rhodoblastus acidophilus]MCW2283243.1 hypothetical protein [Rhodoblastus acidophilus]MCW2332103.1 hypothetical protein [Rhodoblastus acidophilus]
MTDPLYRLIYHSSSRMVGADDDLDGALRAILAASRRNNLDVGVTGALMFTARCFVQVLEGPRAEVERLFQKIKRDERHGGVALVSFGPVAERAFPHWSMAFVGGPALEARFEAFARETGYEPARMSGDLTLGFLQSVLRAREGDAQASDGRLAG